MKFVTAKDLRTQASSIWIDLPREQELVITLNGKPVAIMTATSDKEFEHSLRAIRRARAMEAVSSLQQASVQSGRDAITEKKSTQRLKDTESAKMNVVIDTNVIVSGLLKPFSPSGDIMRMIADAMLQICYDARILLEYEQVLRREKFGFDPAMVAIVMDSIKEIGVCTTGSSVKVRLPDPADEMFVEVASDPQCRLLITGNGKHFPKTACGNVKVLSPREFVAFFRRCENEL